MQCGEGCCEVLLVVVKGRVGSSVADRYQYKIVGTVEPTTGPADDTDAASCSVAPYGITELPSDRYERHRGWRFAHPYVNKPAAMDATGLEKTTDFVAEPEVWPTHGRIRR
jgi:hypothetical protein